MRRITHHERIATQRHRFHVSYSFVHDGYFVYVRYPDWWIRLFGWMVNLAGKLPYERLNHVPFDDEHKAWIALEERCLRTQDWHGVGYARAMRKELARLDGRTYSDSILRGMHGIWEPGPSWINSVYLPPEQEAEKNLDMTPLFSYRLKSVHIDGTHIYEVRTYREWHPTFEAPRDESSTEKLNIIRRG